MPKNINLKIDQTTYDIIILQNKIPYISRGLTINAMSTPEGPMVIATHQFGMLPEIEICQL